MTRFRLIQARTADEVVGPEEHQSFADHMGVPVDCIETISALGGDLTFDAVTRDVDAVLVGGSGKYSVTDSAPWLPNFFSVLKDLADADFPSNNGGWQWAASTGTDAAPYFRVFNPDTQRDRFDGKNEYVARWAPEHVNGTAPPPLVDLKQARVRAIEAFKLAKNG